MRRIITLALTIAAVGIVQAQSAIGQWRDCLDYSTVYHVALGEGSVYGAARGAVFCHDTDYGTLSRMSKGAGLNDVGIATMAYSKDDKCLVVAYNNSNIDLVIDGKTYNLSDIKRSEMAGNKDIYHIRFAKGNAYLATGFGVVVVDLGRQEIKETWYMGAGGTVAPVYDLAFVGDSIYAATSQGLKRLAATERHPSVSDRWETDMRLAGYTITTLENYNGRLLLAGHISNPQSKTLLVLNSTGYRTWNHGDIRSMRAGGGLVTLTCDKCVVRYNRDLQRYDSLDSYPWGSLVAYDAVTDDDGTLWIGHLWEGLIGMTADGEFSYLRPDGPYLDDKVYRIVPFNNRIMVCPGGHTVTYGSTYNESNLLTYSGGRWHSLNRDNGLMNGTADLLDAAVNPKDTNETFAALWGSGVISIRDNAPTALYNEANTGGALTPFINGDFTSLITSALAFDRAGDLWVLASHTSNALAVRRANGTWEKFSTMALGQMLEVDKIVWDSINDYKWFCGRSNAIYVHDGKGRLARVNPNNGSKLTTESVTALVQDHNGNLWVGTNKGIKVIYDGYRAFQNGGNGETSPVTCSNITITNGEFSEYLMAYESVTSIAVDGANRKWVGTANGGLYLLSANGLDQLEHFTAANSPLLSDKVIALGINGRSGEVYIGTDQGLQVYRSTATYATTKPQSEVYAFPNPVRPDYDGPIAIKGLTRNALVHITDAGGHTVYSTSAEGGQAIWYGRTHDGDKVASGVYYVFASDEQGDNRSVAKILIIR